MELQTCIGMFKGGQSQKAVKQYLATLGLSASNRSQKLKMAQTIYEAESAPSASTQGPIAKAKPVNARHVPAKATLKPTITTKRRIGHQEQVVAATPETNDSDALFR